MSQNKISASKRGWFWIRGLSCLMIFVLVVGAGSYVAQAQSENQNTAKTQAETTDTTSPLDTPSPTYNASGQTADSRNLLEWGADVGINLAGKGVDLLLKPVLSSILGVIALVEGLALMLLSSLFETVVNTTSNLMQEIKDLWNISLDIGNLFLLFALIFMASTIILRKAGGYDFKKAFSTIIVALIASNVSFMFAKLINDLSIGTTYLIKSLFDQLDTTAGATTSLIPFAQVVTALNRKLFATLFTLNTTSLGYVLGIILTVVCTVVGIKILIVIVERTAQMLFRLVSAPIIFSLAVFGGDTGPITKWFIEFTGWAMVLPFLGFFFEISRILFALAPGGIEGMATSVSTLSAASAFTGPDAVDTTKAIIMFILGTAVTWQAGDAANLVVKLSSISKKYMESAGKTVLEGSKTMAWTGANFGGNIMANTLGRIPGKTGQFFQRFKDIGTQAVGWGTLAKNLPEKIKEQRMKPADRSSARTAETLLSTYSKAPGLIQSTLYGGKPVEGALESLATKGFFDDISKWRDDVGQITNNLAKGVKEKDEAKFLKALSAASATLRENNRNVSQADQEVLLKQLLATMGTIPPDFFKKAMALNTSTYHANFSQLKAGEGLHAARTAINQLAIKHGLIDATAGADQQAVVNTVNQFTQKFKDPVTQQVALAQQERDISTTLLGISATLFTLVQGLIATPNPMIEHLLTISNNGISQLAQNDDLRRKLGELASATKDEDKDKTEQDIRALKSVGTLAPGDLQQLITDARNGNLDLKNSDITQLLAEIKNLPDDATRTASLGHTRTLMVTSRAKQDLQNSTTNTGLEDAIRDNFNRQYPTTTLISTARRIAGQATSQQFTDNLKTVIEELVKRNQSASQFTFADAENIMTNQGMTFDSQKLADLLRDIMLDAPDLNKLRKMKLDQIMDQYINPVNNAIK